MRTRSRTRRPILGGTALLAASLLYATGANGADRDASHGLEVTLEVEPWDADSNSADDFIGRYAPDYGARDGYSCINFPWNHCTTATPTDWTPRGRSRWLQPEGLRVQRRLGSGHAERHPDRPAEQRHRLPVTGLIAVAGQRAHRPVPDPSATREGP